MRTQIVLLFSAFACASVSAQNAQQQPSTGPEQVVRQYCDFDFKIGRISTDNFRKLPPLYTWEEEPGWDGVTLVSSFKIVSTKVTQDRAIVTVDWHVAGEFGAEKVTAPRQKDEIVEYQVKLVGGSWKIDSPLLCPHVSAKTMRAFVLSNYKDDASRQALIRELDAVTEKGH
ncbi:MAG TPA: hypothetical protein VE077_19785 [Candidatus Methylomirabilis sp.]|nr:hypothetical protein [Candidatus Methylomirabilis sp.]